MHMVAVVLVSLSCLGVACQDVAAPDRRPEPSVQVAISGDSVRLTYICGNTFRLRNHNADYVEVRWDIFRTADSGRLVLPARPTGAAFSQVFVTAAVRGTMRVFVNGRLEETKANGGQPPCETAGQETAWPDSGRTTATTRGDMMIPVVVDADTSYLSRTEFGIVFHDSVSNAGRRAFISAHRGVVVTNRGRGLGVIAAFPATAPTREAILAFRAMLRSDPRVVVVNPRRGGRIVVDGRYPNDDSGWISPERLESDAALWFLRAIRLPQAWGCLQDWNGVDKPDIAVVEGGWADQHPDLAGAEIAQREAARGIANLLTTPGPGGRDLEDHAAAVTGLAAATGDNAAGLSGVTWQPKLRLFRLASSGGDLADSFETIFLLTEALRSGASAVVLSSDVLSHESDEGARTDLIADAAALIAESLRASTSNRVMVVPSSGNDAFVGTAAQYAQRRSFMLLHAALFSLRTDPAFADRIVVVTGTAADRSLWSDANYIVGATDIAAPASRIPVLSAGRSFPVSIREKSGTSYAAPVVAATLAAMASAAPQLSPAELKALLLAGTHVPDLRPDGTLGRVGDVTSGNSAVAGLRELDVYGALVALRRRVPTAPLCGDRLSLRETPSGWRVEMAPDSGAARHLDLPAFVFPQEVFSPGWGSVAPGGRTLSVNAISAFGDPLVLTYRLQSGGWNLVNTLLTDERRVFLERDTLYWSPTSDRLALTGRLVRRTGATVPVDGAPLRTAFPTISGTFQPQLRDLAVAPDGRDLIASYSFGNADLCTASSPVGVAAVSWRIGAVTAVPFDFTQVFEDCFGTGYPIAARAAWHPSSRSLVVGTQTFGLTAGPSTVLRRYRRTDAGALQLQGTDAVTGVMFALQGVRSDGASVLGATFDFDTGVTACQVRGYPRLGQLLATIGDCGESDIAPLLRTAPSSLRLRPIAVRRR